MPAMSMQQMEQNLPKDGLRLDNLLTQKILLWDLLCQKTELYLKGFKIFSSDWEFRMQPLMFFWHNKTQKERVFTESYLKPSLDDFSNLK